MWFVVADGDGDFQQQSWFSSAEDQLVQFVDTFCNIHGKEAQPDLWKQVVDLFPPNVSSSMVGTHSHAAAVRCCDVYGSATC